MQVPPNFLIFPFCQVIRQFSYLLISVDASILRYFEIKVVRTKIMAENVCNRKLLCLRCLCEKMCLCAWLFVGKAIKKHAFCDKKRLFFRWQMCPFRPVNDTFTGQKGVFFSVL